MSDKKLFPNASISFDMPCDEKTMEFFNRMKKEHKDTEDAVRERITQLFEEFVEVGGKDDLDYAKKQFLTLFGIGYQLGWNDRKNVEDYTKGS